MSVLHLVNRKKFKLSASSRFCNRKAHAGVKYSSKADFGPSGIRFLGTLLAVAVGHLVTGQSSNTSVASRLMSFFNLFFCDKTNMTAQSS